MGQSLSNPQIITKRILKLETDQKELFVRHMLEELVQDPDLARIVANFPFPRPMRERPRLVKSAVKILSCPSTGHSRNKPSDISSLKSNAERSTTSENDFDSPCASVSDDPATLKERATVRAQAEKPKIIHRRTRKRRNQNVKKSASPLSCRNLDYISSIQHSSHTTSMRWHICQNLVRQSEGVKLNSDAHPSSAKGDNKM